MRKLVSCFSSLLMLFSYSVYAREFCEDEVPIKSVPPAYPRIESPVGHSGYVVIEFIIDYKGEVTSPKVVVAVSEPTGRFAEPFAEAAIAALNQWSYEPRQIACESSQKFVFELTE
ncbi:TonB family protein [Microbulbifer aggregans]|uniref:TonB family protein n=1 Tax=Microbulbifer aggregans TaxID=1769779 RepID=UPI001CFC62FD|nr:TonB family protein [Microbulbifer aggregans]